MGLLLPYTPLHHLLLADVKRPLVMTSGNLAEEPIAYRNDEARERLSGIADLFLMHDRPIVTRCDDSVARVTAGRPVLFRRSRGYVPRALPLAQPLQSPVLACGALLKNTFCLARGSEAWLGPHIGDLENLETYQSFEESIERMERFLGIAPRVIAHDLHPDYLSTHYAQRRPETIKIAVQHHHAHVASAMAEHKLAGPVLGVAYDGTGFGPDGTSWGGELLLADYCRFERLATFRPIRLAGGDVAIREPWRLALALLEDAFDGRVPTGALKLFRTVTAEPLRIVRQMLDGEMQLPLAHGVGRYFDAVGALVLNRPLSRFEGQIALELNLAADPADRKDYPFTVSFAGSPWVVDLREAIRSAVFDLMAECAAGSIAARFHNTVCAATLAILREARRVHGRLPVVLTGGCFQNARLTETLLAAGGQELAIHAPGDVPPGDGGIASARRSWPTPSCQAGLAHDRFDRGGVRCVSAFPGRIVSVDGLVATVDFWGIQRQVRLELVDEPVVAGDYILNHVGFAIRRIPEPDIDGTLALYEELLRDSEQTSDLMAADVRSELDGTKQC